MSLILRGEVGQLFRLAMAIELLASLIASARNFFLFPIVPSLSVCLCLSCCLHGP